MANEKIMLMAQANKLGVSGYKKMSEAELRAAIKSAKSATPMKGKASPNGATAKGKAAPAKGKATPAKGKPKGAAAPAKSTAQKSTPAKGAAAKGTAKRPTATEGEERLPRSMPKLRKMIEERGLSIGPGRQSVKRLQSILHGGVKPTAAKGRGKAATPAKGSATTAKKSAGRAEIDNKAVDWKRESGVGKSGKRAWVLDSLRKHKGNKSEVFSELKRHSTKWYPHLEKHAADRLLVWLIGRVAFDYVMNTGQHKPGKRVSYGESQKTQDIRRRERRAAQRAEQAKTERKAKRQSTARKPTRKATPKTTAKEQTPKGRTTTARKGKGK